jgi:hypothetical protein
MELALLLLISSAVGIAVGSQFSRQPPQITVVQVQPDELRGGTGGCAPVIIAVGIFIALAWLVSTLSAS